MKSILKTIIAVMAEYSISILNLSKVTRYFRDQCLSAIFSQTASIKSGDNVFVFPVPNVLTRARADTLLTKEPQTIDWLNDIPNKSVFWDIGANIGLYSVYAAKERDCQVFAFEPSVFNLELLARSVYLNEVVDNVVIVPLALAESTAPNLFNLTNVTWGGALSAFGDEIGYDGKRFRSVFNYKWQGVSVDDAVGRLGIPKPEYIKIDVDGFEHHVLVGAQDTLKSIKSLIIEINDDYFDQAEQCQKLLSAAGLKFVEKRHASNLSGNSPSGRTYSHLWRRD
jgi:FkbM family methyltransferase